MPKRTKRGPPSASDMRVEQATHSLEYMERYMIARKEKEREREWTWEPRHAVTGKSQPRRRKKSWAHVRVRASPLFPSFLLPDEMTVPGREMDRIMG